MADFDKLVVLYEVGQERPINLNKWFGTGNTYSVQTQPSSNVSGSVASNVLTVEWTTSAYGEHDMVVRVTQGSSTDYTIRFVVLDFTMDLELDEDGWTVLTPAGDSRMIYVSNAGSDSNDGLSDSTPKLTIAAAKALVRSGYSDWIHLRRGDTFAGPFGAVPNSGRSSTERHVLTSYGTGARPIIECGDDIGLYGFTDKSFWAIKGIHFYANGRDPASGDWSSASGAYGIQWLSASGDPAWSHVLIEDCDIQLFSTNISIQDRDDYDGDLQVAIRRNIIRDAYATASHSQGLFTHGMEYCLVEENILTHNGWYNDRDNGGDGIQSGAVDAADATAFNHGIYFDTEGPTTGPNSAVLGNIIHESSSHGIQMRPGGYVLGNMIARCPIGILFGGLGEPAMHPSGITGAVNYNAIFHCKDITSSQQRGQAMFVEYAVDSTIKENVIAHKEDASTTNDWGINLVSDATNPIDNLDITGNVFWQHDRGYVTTQGGYVTNVTPTGNYYFDGGHSAPDYSGNFNSDVVTFADSDADVGTYNASLGGTDDAAEFIADAIAARTLGTFEYEYSADAFRAYAATSYTPTDVTVPDAPTGLAATAGDSQIVLNWDDNAEGDLDFYRVYRSTSSGSGYTLIANPAASAYTDATAVNGTTYYYVVRAVDTSGNASTNSSEVSESPTASGGGGGGVYELWSHYDTPAALDQLTDATLSEATIFITLNSLSATFWATVKSDGGDIRCSDSAGETELAWDLVEWDYGSEAGLIAVKVPLSSNQTPDAIRIYYGNASATLPDVDSTYGGEAAYASYIKGCWPDGLGTDRTENANAWTLTNAPTVGGVAGPIDGSTATQLSTTQSAVCTTLDAIPIVEPVSLHTIVAVTADAQSRSPLWISEATSSHGFQLQLHSSANQIRFNSRSASATGTAGSASDYNTAGTYQQVGGRSSGTSSRYAILNGVAGTENTTAVTVPTLDRMIVESAPTAGTMSVSMSIIANVALSNAWYAWMWSMLDVADSDQSDFTGGWTSNANDSAPNNPTGLSATPGEASVVLDWNDNSEPDLDFYRVYRSTTSGSGYTLVASPSTSNYTDTGVVNNTTYYYVVRAVDDGGNASTDSGEVSATPSDSTPPSAPTGLAATPGNALVLLDWNDSGAPDIDFYRVYRSTTSGSGHTLLASPTESNYVDVDAANNTTYYYFVRAVDTSSNVSENSSEVSATPIDRGMIMVVIVMPYHGVLPAWMMK